MSFTLPTLPYDYTALEPYIDGETMHVREQSGDGRDWG
jgi:superoxide dismutase